MLAGYGSGSDESCGHAAAVEDDAGEAVDYVSEEADIENTSELQKTVIMNVLLSAYPDILQWVAGVSDCSNAVSKQAHDIILSCVREVGKESKEAAALHIGPVLCSCILIKALNDHRDNLRSLNAQNSDCFFLSYGISNMLRPTSVFVEAPSEESTQLRRILMNTLQISATSTGRGRRATPT